LTPFEAEQSSREKRTRPVSICGIGGWSLCALVLLCGCLATGRKSVHLPERHTLKSEQLVVLSDFKLPKDHPLLGDLATLRGQESESLGLEFNGDDVKIYLFRDEMEYHKYLQTAHPGLPSRRAYFISSKDELAVYTYWGERIQEDLRHEYTHGLLHSALLDVPLWLDEGLAEYFEVIGPKAGTINPEYAERLSKAIQNGWEPDIARLESLEKVDQMQRADYREAWAWVHFMLHHTPDTRQVLLTYLSELKTNRKPEELSVRLKRELPEYKSRFLSYVSTLRLQHAGDGRRPQVASVPEEG